MKKHLLFILSFFLLSCNSYNKTENENTSTSPNVDSVTPRTDSASSNVNSENAGSQRTTYNGFDRYWEDFKIAVKTNDTIRLSSLTKFPFLTRGTLDSDPTINHRKKDFPRLFKVILAQGTGLSLDGETEADVISRPGILEDKKYTHVGDDWARVSNLEFQRQNGKWKLASAYLNYETVEELNNNND